MSRLLSSSYQLKRFRSSGDPGFAAALLLYVRNTPPAVRTDSNEVTYWLDQPDGVRGNAFYVFGFYRDGALVGYAEAGFLRSQRLLAFDYVVVEESARRNNVFFEFVDHLRRYFEGWHPDYRYVTAEVGYGPGQEFPSQESCLLTRLLKIQGFRVVRAPYLQPRLFLEDPESEMRADLLVFSPAPVESLSVETYLSIVRTLYYEYYLPWKAPFCGSEATYRRHVDNLYRVIESKVRGRRRVVVNGHKKLLHAPSRRPIVTVHRIVAFATQALGVVILLTAAMLGLRVVFRLSDAAFAVTYVLALGSFVALAGIVSKDARLVLGQLIGLAKHALRRRAVRGYTGRETQPGANDMATPSPKPPEGNGS